MIRPTCRVFSETRSAITPPITSDEPPTTPQRTPRPGWKHFREAAADGSQASCGLPLGWEAVDDAESATRAWRRRNAPLLRMLLCARSLSHRTKSVTWTPCSGQKMNAGEREWRAHARRNCDEGGGALFPGPAAAAAAAATALRATGAVVWVCGKRPSLSSLAASIARRQYNFPRAPIASPYGKGIGFAPWERRAQPRDDMPQPKLLTRLRRPAHRSGRRERAQATSNELVRTIRRPGRRHPLRADRPPCSAVPRAVTSAVRGRDVGLTAVNSERFAPPPRQLTRCVRPLPVLAPAPA